MPGQGGQSSRWSSSSLAEQLRCSSTSLCQPWAGYRSSWLRLFVSSGLLLLTGSITPIQAAKPAQNYSAATAPLSPAEALNAFSLADNLTIELVAAEPHVIDPVAIAFGSAGELWVVEMRDYPDGPAPGEPSTSMIKRLIDTNGDGDFEHSMVFAGGLKMATGLLPWQDGVIVTVAGEILFLADRNGDGIAEYREPWFGGFAQENSQLRANHPTLGPDGRIYVANGLRGGTVVATRPSWSERPAVQFSGFDFSFDPHSGAAEPVVGNAQFGLCFDAFGERFYCSNRNPCMHVVLEDRLLRKNPLLAAPQSTSDVCAAGEKSRLFPLSKTWTTSTDHTNQFTAACGVLADRGGALSASFGRCVWTCDPTANAVHAEQIEPSGATFRGTPVQIDREFLASTDRWFRPVNLADGPDGCLYVVDMYRAVIEHPEWMPSELKTRRDLLDGNDRGRIYRVRPRQIEAPLEIFVAITTPQEALLNLKSSVGWRRETAFRLICAGTITLETADWLELAQSPQPETRALAARIPGNWPVDGWLGLLGDSNSHVRTAMLQSLLSRTTQDSPLTSSAIFTSGVIKAFDSQKEVPIGREAIAWAELFAGFSSEISTPRLARLLLTNADDPWIRTAIAASAHQRISPLLAAVGKQITESHPKTAAERATFARPVSFAPLLEQYLPLLVIEVPGEQLAQSLSTWLVLAEASDGEVALTAAIVRGLGTGQARQQTSVGQWIDSQSATAREAWHQRKVRLRECVRSAEAPIGNRLDALSALAWLPAEQQTVAEILTAVESDDPRLQTAALNTLTRLRSETAAAALLESFPSRTPLVRRGIVSCVLASTSTAKLLLDAIEQGQLPVGEVSADGVAQLLASDDQELRARAERLFTSTSNNDRAALVELYSPALEEEPASERGKPLFERHCASCHRLGSMGASVGPDLGDTREKTASYLLTNILDPNRVVDSNFHGYAIVLKDGRVLTGLIAQETSTSLTLRQPDGKQEVLLRQEIEELRSTGLSLMPVGFEKQLDPQQMRDLIGFVKNWRYLDGSVPLAKP